MLGTLAIALAGASAALSLLLILTLAIILFRHFLLHSTSIPKTPETNSSEPSLQGAQDTEFSVGGARRFLLEELSFATRGFNDTSLIGCGTMGQAHKGLLRDGTIAAIKRMPASSGQDFVHVVCYLSSIRHRNLVSLLGYCQENDLQMLIYEYIPNGSVSIHLSGPKQVSGKLEFKHRLSIAHGAAKGLSHLHSLSPPLVHKNFKTRNVLVDDNFTPKVADAGMRSLLDQLGDAGSSSQLTNDNVFVDPEANKSGIFSVKSDVYSFGVFLLELASGKEAITDQSIIEWAKIYKGSSDIATIVDVGMGGRFSFEDMREFLQLSAWCVNPLSELRPHMNYVVSQLQRIHDREMRLTTVVAEGTTTVILGSQLFTTS